MRRRGMAISELPAHIADRAARSGQVDLGCDRVGKPAVEPNPQLILLFCIGLGPARAPGLGRASSRRLVNG